MVRREKTFVFYCNLKENTLNSLFFLIDFAQFIIIAFRAAQKASNDEHQQFSHPITIQNSSFKKKMQLEMSFVSIYTILHHLSIIGFIIFIIYIIENHPPFPNSQRYGFDVDMFVFLILLFVIVAIFSIKKNPGYEDKDDTLGHISNTNKGGMRQQKQQRTRDHNQIIDSKSISSSSTKSHHDEVINIQTLNSTRRRFAPTSVFSSDQSIQSDDLISLLEKDIENGSRNGSVSVNRDRENIQKDPTSTSISSTPVKADQILDEILLDEMKSDAKSAVSTNSDVLSDLPVFSPNVDSDILNVHQGLELKGFMTICFLLYQFSNAYSYESTTNLDVNQGTEEKGEDISTTDGVNYYYNISRIFVTAFLFLTGYGHAMFFYRHKDYSMSRLIRVLFRMNFSGMLLCLALGKPYIFYQACWLHTYFFLFIYATMKWRNEKNYTKYSLRLKIFFLAIIIFLLWDCDSVLWKVHVILFGPSQQSVEGAPYGQIWEFYFRGYLHHWASLIGMVFAINQPVTSLLMRKLEIFGSVSEMSFKSITGTLLIVTFFVWMLGPFESSKYVYNATNPYFGILPVICFVYFRNINQVLRGHHIEIFKSVGVYSLEIYLLHHHLFITADGTMKKIFLPGYSACNLLLSIWLIMTLSKALRISSSVVITMITSHNTTIGRNVIALLGTLVIFHAISIILEFFNMITPEVIVTAIIICGILLYQTVMDLTWTNQNFMTIPMFDSASISSIQTTSTISPVSKSSPPILGTATILLLCLTWQLASMNGSNKVDILPPVCSETVNDGTWVPINACSEYQQGKKARDFHSRLSSNNCYENYEWGWSQNDLSSKCQFNFVSPIEAQRKLKNKKIVFIGDSMTRHLYFAFCRALGDNSAGDYDETLPVHSEIIKKFGSITVTFKWAALVTDILTKIKNSKTSGDLVLFGSGAWDKLHLWATDEDQKFHIESLKRLAREIQSFKERSIPTIWFTPTTMNTRALKNEEYRTQMSESSVQEMRQIYAENGINAAATFVLQGHTFTETQSGLSYDGIHYPPQIYDVGAQIMMNALDWLVVMMNNNINNDISSSQSKYVDESFKPKIGIMANQSLGLMLLALVLISLLFHDGFFGLLYIASIFVQPRQVPNRVTLLYAPDEHLMRYSFIPSNAYAELYLYHKMSSKNNNKKQKHTSENNEKGHIAKSPVSSRSSIINNRNNHHNQDDFSNGTVSSATTTPSRRSLGNLSTIREDHTQGSS